MHQIIKTGLVLFLVSLISFTSTGQGIDFFHGSFEEALEAAKDEGKAIFVDAYTTWCGPCKRMSKYVFTEQIVGQFYNSNFINMKLDMEKEEGMKFGLKYPVSAYPTFYYIKPNGDVLFTTKGGRKAKQFIELGEKALSRFDVSTELKEKYENGDRSPETVIKYIQALNRKGESGLKVANEFLDNQSDLSSEESLMVINAAAVEADSRIFDLFIQHKEQIIALTSNEKYLEKAKKACEATVQKAIEFEVEDLLAEAKDKYSKIASAESLRFGLESDMKYYAATKESKPYIKSSKKYIKKIAGKNARQINDVVEDMIEHFRNDASVMKVAEKPAKRAAETGGLSKYYLNYAYTLFYQKKYEKSEEIANQALSLGEQEKVNLSPVRSLISKLQQL